MEPLAQGSFYVGGERVGGTAVELGDLGPAGHITVNEMYVRFMVRGVVLVSVRTGWSAVIEAITSPPHAWPPVWFTHRMTAP